MHDADGKDGAIAGEINARVGRGDMRIPAKVVIFKRVVPAGVGVVAAEPVAEVIAIAAELGLAGLRIELPGAIGERTNAQVTAVDVGCLACTDVFDVPAAIAIRQINPAIHAPAQAVDAVLLVAFVEAGEERGAFVRFAVGVVWCGILCIKNVGGCGDEDAFVPDHDARGEVQVIEEDGAAVVLAIAVCVFEEDDAAGGFYFAICIGNARRIIAHLDDPEFSIRAKVESDRVHHQRLSGDELCAKAGDELNRIARSLRRARRRRRSMGSGEVVRRAGTCRPAVFWIGRHRRGSHWCRGNFRGDTPRLAQREHFLKRDLLHMMRLLPACVLVLPVERIAFDEEAVVRTIGADDGGKFFLSRDLAALAIIERFLPFRLRIEQR